jgi:hypothetical protein
MIGHNGDLCYATTGNSLLNFFAKAGNITKNANTPTYYGSDSLSGLILFKEAWEYDNYKAMQLAMWVRDIRGGAGNRQAFRDIITWLGYNYPQWILANLSFIPQVGRWDDLLSLRSTICEQKALEIWVDAIKNKNGLAAKWAPRERSNPTVFKAMRKIAKMSPKDYRKLLASNTNVVEGLMCDNKWEDVNYNSVPSVAISRLATTFHIRDLNRFKAWKQSLSDKKSGNKVNAAALFPHDCIKTLNSGDAELANAQFDALPNFIDGTKLRILCVADFSGSMITPVLNDITAMDVAMGLSLYCSEKIGEGNPFYRKFIPFSDNSELVHWREMTFSEAARKCKNGYCGSTNIKGALLKILEYAKLFNVTNEQIPNCLMILSDMQFDCSCSDDETSVESAMREWEEAGYARPKIVYWNLCKYDGYASNVVHKDVALVSGFSPSILKPVLDGEDFTPITIMERAIAKYEIVRPI